MQIHSPPPNPVPSRMRRIPVHSPPQNQRCLPTLPKSEHIPVLDELDPRVYAYNIQYQRNVIIYDFNGPWPSTSAFRGWLNQTWTPNYELLFYSNFLLSILQTRQIVKLFSPMGLGFGEAQVSPFNPSSQSLSQPP